MGGVSYQVKHRVLRPWSLIRGSPGSGECCFWLLFPESCAGLIGLPPKVLASSQQRLPASRGLAFRSPLGKRPLSCAAGCNQSRKWDRLRRQSGTARDQQCEQVGNLAANPPLSKSFRVCNPVSCLWGNSEARGHLSTLGKKLPGTTFQRSPSVLMLTATEIDSLPYSFPSLIQGLGW